jgi:hypothetical protein
MRWSRRFSEQPDRAEGGDVITLESRVNALEQLVGGGDESGLIVVKVVEVDADGSETVRKKVYVDPLLKCTVPAPDASEEGKP